MSEPNGPPPLLSWRTLRSAGVGLAAFGLLATVLEFPRAVYGIGHDESSVASLDYFAARGMQFGADVIQNAGPLGWAHQVHVYSGLLHAQKLVLHGVLRAALVVLLLLATRWLRSRVAQAAWLALPIASIAFGAATLDSFEVTGEVWNDLTVYLAGLAMIALPGGWRRATPLLALLAVFALEKHTLLAAAGIAVAAAMLERLRRGAPGAAIAIGATFAAFVALVWLGAGQRLAHLPDYALGVLRFSAGYNEALGLPSSATSLRFGVPIAAALGAVILVRALARSQSPAKSLLDAAFLFLAWKHGFVRADGVHVAIFLTSALFFALPFALACEERDSPRQRRTLGAIAAGVAVASAAGILAILPGARFQPARPIELWSRNLAWIVAPGRQTAALDRALQQAKDTYALPAIGAIVGDAPVDLFGYRPGWLLLNGFDYRPRPTPIPFAVADAALRRDNEAFLRDAARAPRFVAVELGSIDARVTTLDDGLALGALFDLYHPVATERDLVLLERNATAPASSRAERRVVAERTVAIGERLDLDADASEWLWLEADVQPSLLGRLRSLVLRPASLGIELTIEGRERPELRGYIASMGASGFLVSPLVQTNADLVAAYAGGALPAVRAIRFVCEPAQCASFDPSDSRAHPGGSRAAPSR